MSVTFGFKRSGPISDEPNELKVQSYSPGIYIREWVKELWALLPMHLRQYLLDRYDSDDELAPFAGPYYVIGAKTLLAKARAAPLVEDWADAVKIKYGYDSVSLYKDMNFCYVYEFFPPSSYGGARGF